jgi:energy-coupling factor transporter ATP-binding protein EcfA2
MTKRNTLVPEQELMARVRDILATAPNTPVYRSWYVYSPQILEHVKVTGSVANFTGPRMVGAITLDIDRGGSNDANVQQRAQAFYQQLTEDLLVSEEHIRIFFSGSGYHFTLPNLFDFASEDCPTVVKETLKAVFPMCDDIYDGARIIRVANTMNPKTSLFKIPLYATELLHKPWEFIHELARQPRTDFEYQPWQITYEDRKLSYLKRRPEMRKKSEALQMPFADTSRIITCVQKMYNEGAKEGSRHQTILRMASAFRRAGIPFAAVLASIRAWAPEMADEAERLVKNVFQQRYQYGCADPIMSHHCDPKCMFFKNKNYTLPVHDADTQESNFKRALEEGYFIPRLNLKGTYINGDFTFFPGEFVVLTGDTGLGKSALMQGLVLQAKDQPTLYLSTEVDEYLMYRRFIQIAHGWTKEQVYDHYLSSERASLTKPMSHVKMMTVAPKLDAIAKLIAEHEPSIVVIDTTDGIEVEGVKDPTIASDHIARGLKQIAMATKTVIFGVHHLSKAGANSGTLTVHSLKGSASTEHKADKVLAIVQGISANERIFYSLKARDERPFKTLLRYDAENTFRFTTIGEVS